MEKLNIIWTNANEIVFDKMVAMYAHHAKINGWWNDITLIIWGETATITANSELVKRRMQELIHAGVRVLACKACSDSLGTTEALMKIGIDVKYVGEELTRILKSDEKLLTI